MGLFKKLKSKLGFKDASQVVAMSNSQVTPDLQEKISYRYKKIQKGLSDTSNGTPALFMCPDYGRALIVDENGFLCSNVKDDDTLSVSYSRGQFNFRVEGKIKDLVQWMDELEEMASTGSFTDAWRKKSLDISKQVFALIDNAVWNGLLWYYNPYEDAEKRDEAPTLVNFLWYLSTPLEQLEIGMITCIYKVYLHGIGNVAQDTAKAAPWVKLAAEKGDKEAQFTLGVMYLQAIGVDKDYEQAFAWTQKAASQNHASAMYNLAYMYDNGCGVTNDHIKAMECLRKAADLGYEKAKAALS